MRSKYKKSMLWLYAFVICFLAGLIFRLLTRGHDFIGYIFVMTAVLIAVFHYLNKRSRKKLKTALIILITLGIIDSTYQ